MNVDGCLRCGAMDHWRELCPLRQPPDGFPEHQRRIALYIDRWAERKTTTDLKREFIKEEHEMWNAKKAKRRAA